MKNFAGMAALVANVFLFACAQEPQSDSQWIKVDNQAATALEINFSGDIETISVGQETSVILASPEALEEIPSFMHDTFKRCGGFFAFDDEDAAMSSFMAEETTPTPAVPDADFSIDQGESVTAAINLVKKDAIRATIDKLSQYNNRYYKADTGVQSQNWVHDTWAALGAETEGFSVELFEHTAWPQPSVIATWTGSETPDEVVIVGGHGDSIAGYFGRELARAPGADDNASGIATITETIRVLIASGYQPKKTLKFMSYAAEEVGLKGSNEIAQKYQADNISVVAVMQLDMTNHSSTPNQMALIRDNTDDELSNFNAKLIDTYLPEVERVDDECGYACSDHASWTRAGFRSTFPFESAVSDINQLIHTRNDTLDNSDNSAAHATNFAKVAAAFMIEIAK